MHALVDNATSDEVVQDLRTAIDTLKDDVGNESWVGLRNTAAVTIELVHERAERSVPDANSAREIANDRQRMLDELNKALRFCRTRIEILFGHLVRHKFFNGRAIP